MTDEPWHLDKRVPVALIVTLILQSALAVWWASDISSRQSAIESRVAVHEQQIDAMRNAAAAASVSLARVEENIGEIRTDVTRILQYVTEGRP